MRRTFVRFFAIGLMATALAASGEAAADPQAKLMKPALLVIDIQNAYLRSQGRQELSKRL